MSSLSRDGAAFDQIGLLSFDDEQEDARYQSIEIRTVFQDPQRITADHVDSAEYVGGSTWWRATADIDTADAY